MNFYQKVKGIGKVAVPLVMVGLASIVNGCGCRNKSSSIASSRSSPQKDIPKEEIIVEPQFKFYYSCVDYSAESNEVSAPFLSSSW